jgi:hypothetical protein
MTAARNSSLVTDTTRGLAGVYGANGLCDGLQFAFGAN